MFIICIHMYNVCMSLYLYIYIYIDRLNARNCKVKTLRASQSLSETFPGTGYEVFSLEGNALRGNRVARIGI